MFHAGLLWGHKGTIPTAMSVTARIAFWGSNRALSRTEGSVQRTKWPVRAGGKQHAANKQ